jgi:hypothetical protein
MPTFEAELPRLAELDRLVQAMSEAASPSDLLRLLHDASRWAVPRGAIFLIRAGEVRGWNSVGYAPDVAAALRQARMPCAPGPREVSAPNFGQPHPDDRVVVSVTIRGMPIALLLGERFAGESPWFPEILQLLATVARMRLELDLALRKLAGAGATTASAVEITGRDEAGSGSPPVREDPPPVAAPESAAIVAARRYARLVATDIRLYHEQQILLGQRNGDLVERLRDQLGLGKETFLRRHADLGPAGMALLHEAYVQVLAAGNAELIPAAALE